MGTPYNTASTYNISSASDLEIERILVLSTAHITKETSELLEKEAHSDLANYVVHGYEYGWFVLVYKLQEVTRKIPDLGLCLKLAKDNQCKWVRLDRDGPIIDNLPQYSW